MPSVAKLQAAGDVKRLIKALKHWKPDVRKAAALALGEIGDSRGLKPILDMLAEEENAEVRKVAEAARRKLPGGQAPSSRGGAMAGSSATPTFDIQDLKAIVVPIMAKGNRLDTVEVGLAMATQVKCDHCGRVVKAYDAWLHTENRMVCPRCRHEWFKYSFGSRTSSPGIRWVAG